MTKIDSPAASEYLPTDAEQRAEQRENRKQKILQSRLKVLESGHALSDGAKVLFAWALDHTLNSDLNTSFGVAAISIYGASQKLEKSRGTIVRLKKELIDAKLIWISKGHCPGRWDINLWHIEDLDPQQNAVAQTMLKGVWGNGVTRQLPVHVKPPERTEEGRFAKKQDEIPVDDSKTRPVRPQKRGRSGRISERTRPRKCGRTGRENAAGKVKKVDVPGRENAAGPAAEVRPGRPQEYGTDTESLDKRDLQSKEKGEGAPPSNAHDPEKIIWEGRHWWISQLHTQLGLLDRELAGAEGAPKRELLARRNSLLVALGVKKAVTSKPTKAPTDTSQFKLPPKAEWESYIAKMRAAV